MELPITYHNKEAEQTVIATLLADEEGQHIWMPELGERFFFDGFARKVFLSMATIYEKKKSVSIPDLSTYLNHDETVDLIGMVEKTSYSKIGRLFETLDRCMRVRESAKIIHKHFSNPNELDIQEVSEKLLSLGIGDNQFEEYSMRDLADRKHKDWEKNENPRRTFHLGIPLVDDYVRLKEGNTVVIVAPPKVGKTWMECAIASFLSSGDKVYYVSAEMHPEDLYTRIASNISQKDLSDLDYMQKPPLSLYNHYSMNIHEIVNRQLRILNARGINAGQLKARIQSAVNRGYRIVIIDYLQRIGGVSKDDYRMGMATLSRELANLFARHNILGIVATQANEPGDNKMTRASDVKETKAPKEDADVLLTLTNTTFFKGEGFYSKGDPYKLAIEIIQRNGYCGTVRLEFDPKTGTYTG